MEEKEEIKIRLGTVINIFIILILFLGIGILVYNNYKLNLDIKDLTSDMKELKTEKESIVKELNVLQQKNEVVNDTTINNNSNVSNIPNVQNEEEKEDVYEKLLKGDFSGVAGEYVNSKGEVETLLSNGLLKGDNGKRPNLPIKQADGSFHWGGIGPGGGDTITLWPVGIPVTDPRGNDSSYDVESNVTVLRIFIGQDWPTSEDHIYYKK